LNSSGQGSLQRERGPARLEAFSDGVFGIAMTLLVLHLVVPGPGGLAGSSLGQKLLSLWPSFIAYVTSFMTILIMWINHHNLFSLVKRVDRPFLFYNGVLLLFTTFVPFPTSLVADYLQHRDAGTATAVYSGTALLIALSFNLLWRHASGKGGLLDERVTAEVIRSITRQYYVGPSVYAAALVLSLVSPVGSVALCAAVAAFYALTATVASMRG